jgi:hypothetical protein
MRSATGAGFYAFLLRGSVALAACAASGTYLSAQTHPSRADSIAGFPDTPIGKLGRTLIEVINSGDSTARTDFVAGHVSEAAIK